MLYQLSRLLHDYQRDLYVVFLKCILYVVQIQLYQLSRVLHDYQRHLYDMYGVLYVYTVCVKSHMVTHHDIRKAWQRSKSGVLIT